MDTTVLQIQEALIKPQKGTNETWEKVLDDNRYFDGVYLFFSFDLVNSTIFKSQYNEKWQNVFTRFYELVATKLAKYYENISIWKYIGDEVLLYLKISDFAEVYDAPVNSLKIIKEVTEILYRDVKESKNKLFIKGTLWIGKVNFLNTSLQNIKEHSDVYKNIAFSSGDLPDWLDQQRIDFLGPDIDLGFRLSKYTQKGQLLISAELAYILYRKSTDINSPNRFNEYKYKPKDCCKIITLEKLKGIWNERRYPIIWFNLDWNLDEIFEYDEYLESELVKVIKETANERQDFDHTIEKIFKDLDKTQEIEEIISLIDNAIKTTVQPLAKYRVSKERLAEVHCAAICFDKEGKIMVARRSQNKTRLKGIWEFGCGQLEMNQDIRGCLEVNYMKDFNAKLSFLEGNPIPVTTYSVVVTEEERTVPGILFFAIIENSEEVIANFDKEKHSEIRWLKIEEIESIPSTDAVENFYESANLAFKIYKAKMG